MGGIADKIYRAAPVTMQNLLVSGYGWYRKRLRLSNQFFTERDAFLSREWFSKEQWQAYQNAKLRELLALALTRVPYYRSAWRGILSLDQIRRFTVADLPALPVLEKAAVRDNAEQFLVDGRPVRDHTINHTSGSSGTPIKTYWLPVEMQRSLAMREARSCRFAGVSYFQPRATFSGRMVEPNPESEGPFHRYNWFERQVYFSAFHLRPDTVDRYLDGFRKHHSVWMTGYAHSIYQLARMALDQGLPVPALKAIITTSEPLTDEMRAVIEEAFRTRVFEEYGAVENLFFVCENEYRQKLINPDCGILEVVDHDASPVPVGTPGAVLATGFIRPGQPMIRYRIGDEVLLSDEPARCGRSMPVLAQITGRLEDTVYGPDGRRMVRFHGIFVDQQNIREGQVIQERLDLLRILVVPKPGYSQTDERAIVSRVQERLGMDMRVIVEPVDSIPRTPSGKFKAVISKLVQ
jgi:phenylacetate-CoA ligase